MVNKNIFYENLSDADKANCIELGKGIFVNLKDLRERTMDGKLSPELLRFKEATRNIRILSMLEDGLYDRPPGIAWLEDLTMFLACEIHILIRGGSEADFATAMGRLLVEMQEILQDAMALLKARHVERKNKT